MDWKTKIKETIKKKDSRFYLMLFIVASTLFFTYLWASSLKGFFVEGPGISQDFEVFQAPEIDSDFEERLDAFRIILEERRVDDDNDKSLSDEDLNKIKGVIESRQEEELDIEDENEGLGIPIISEELEDSQDLVNELKKKIEELEKKLGD